MADTTTIRKRRTASQLAAAKKLPYSDYISGDGDWLVLNKCNRRWRYWLFADQHAAEAFANKPCCNGCRKEHIFWYLYPWDKTYRKPREKKSAEPKIAHMSLPQDVDASAIEWF